MGNWQLPLIANRRVRYVYPTDEHVAHIARHLRPGDAREIEATVGTSWDHEAAIRLSCVSSRSVVVALAPDGEPLTIGGVRTVSLLSNIGSPWMLAAQRVNRFRSALIEGGRAYTLAMLEEYDTLENHVDARNTQSVAWLGRLGYQFDEPEPNHFGVPFRRFFMTR